MSTLSPTGVLLHIGPHKTGTTTVQKAFAEAVEVLAAADVVYLGSKAHREQGPLAAVGRPARVGVRTPTQRDWDEVLAAVAANAHRRVVLSSERYCWADEGTASRIIDQLGRDRVHVVVTLRSLSRILPSQWQMTVQGGLTLTFEEWLRRVFDETTDEARGFWLRHDHGRLVERWARAAGAEHVTVVVVDEDEPSMLLDTFAAMLDLPPRALTASARNRSLTAAEAELVRQVNLEFGRRGWSPQVQAAVVRTGLALELARRPAPPKQPRIAMPPWAAEQVSARADAAVAAIATLGVRIVGDLGSLSSVADGHPAAPGEPFTVPAATAAAAVVAAVARGPRISWERDTPRVVAKPAAKAPSVPEVRPRRGRLRRRPPDPA